MQLILPCTQLRIRLKVQNLCILEFDPSSHFNHNIAESKRENLQKSTHEKVTKKHLKDDLFNLKSSEFFKGKSFF